MLRLLPILLVLACPVCAQQSALIPRSAEGPRITLSKTLHDFGRVPQGPQLEHRFAFTNTGRLPLIVTRCQTADPHVASWSPEPILPGKKALSR